MPRSSPTAELMAVMRALESNRPARSRLFLDPFAEYFVSRGWRLLLRATRLGAVRRVVEFGYDWVAGPGPRPSAVARTRLIDDLMLEAISAVEQVVILGAGFDCRSFRTPALERVRVFEVDRPDTQIEKIEALDRALGCRPPHVTFVPVDFERDDLERALEDAGYRTDSSAVFLWEGVTNYLSPSAVDATLRAIRTLSTPGTGQQARIHLCRQESDRQRRIDRLS